MTDRNIKRDVLNRELREVYLRKPFQPHWNEVDMIHSKLFIVNEGRSYG